MYRFKIILAFVLCAGCSPKLRHTETNKQLYPISADMPADSAILAFYRPYKLSIDSQMNVTIARAASEITRMRPEGRLNNLVADAMYEEGKRNHLQFDFAHTNYEGLRTSLPAGEIRTYKIYELMPFENYLVTVTLSGQNTLDLFNYMAAAGGDPLSGASYTIRNKKATDIRIAGKPFDINKNYTILTCDYVANGGDHAVMYTRAIKRADFTLKQRDAIFQYLKRMNAEEKMVNPVINGRIKTDRNDGQ